MADDVKIKLQGSILNSLATQSQNPVASKPSALPQSIISNESLIPKSTPVDNTRVVTALGVISNKMEQGFSQTISSVTKLQVAVTSRLESIHRQLEILNNTMTLVHEGTLRRSRQQEIPRYLRLAERFAPQAIFRSVEQFYRRFWGEINVNALNIAFIRLFSNANFMRRVFGVRSFIAQQRKRQKTLTDELYFTLMRLPQTLFEVSDEIVNSVDRLTTSLNSIGITLTQSIQQAGRLLSQHLLSLQHHIYTLHRENIDSQRKDILPFFEILITSRFQNLREFLHPIYKHFDTKIIIISKQINNFAGIADEFFTTFTKQYDERSDRQHDILEQQLKCCIQTNILLQDILTSVGGRTMNDADFMSHSFMTALTTFKDEYKKKYNSGTNQTRYNDPRIKRRGSGYKKHPVRSDITSEHTAPLVGEDPTKRNRSIYATPHPSLNPRRQHLLADDPYQNLRDTFAELQRNTSTMVTALHTANDLDRTRRDEDLRHRELEIRNNQRRDKDLRTEHLHRRREEQENGAWRRESLDAYDRQYNAIMSVGEAVSTVIWNSIINMRSIFFRGLKYYLSYKMISGIGTFIVKSLATSTGILSSITSGVTSSFNSILPSITGVIKGFFVKVLPDNIQKSFFEISKNIMDKMKTFATMTFSPNDTARDEARAKFFTGLKDVLWTFGIEFVKPILTNIIGLVMMWRLAKSGVNSLFSKPTPKLDEFGKVIPPNKKTWKDVAPKWMTKDRSIISRKINQGNIKINPQTSLIDIPFEQRIGTKRLSQEKKDELFRKSTLGVTDKKQISRIKSAIRTEKLYEVQDELNKKMREKRKYGNLNKGELFRTRKDFEKYRWWLSKRSDVDKKYSFHDPFSFDNYKKQEYNERKEKVKEKLRQRQIRKDRITYERRGRLWSNTGAAMLDMLPSKAAQLKAQQIRERTGMGPAATTETIYGAMKRVGTEVSSSIKSGAIKTTDFVKVVSGNMLGFIKKGFGFVMKAMNWTVMAYTIGKVLFNTLPRLFDFFTNKKEIDDIKKQNKDNTQSMWKAVIGKVTEGVKGYIANAILWFKENKGEIWDTAIGMFTGIIGMISDLVVEFGTDLWLSSKLMVAKGFNMIDLVSDETIKELEEEIVIRNRKLADMAARYEDSKRTDTATTEEEISAGRYEGFTEKLNSGFTSFLTEFQNVTDNLKNLTNVNTTVGQGFSSLIGNFVGKLFGPTEGDKILANAQKYAESKGVEWESTAKFFGHARESLIQTLNNNAAKEAATAAQNAKSAEETSLATKEFSESVKTLIGYWGSTEHRQLSNFNKTGNLLTLEQIEKLTEFDKDVEHKEQYIKTIERMMERLNSGKDEQGNELTEDQLLSIIQAMYAANGEQVSDFSLTKDTIKTGIEKAKEVIIKKRKAQEEIRETRTNTLQEWTNPNNKEFIQTQRKISLDTYMTELWKQWDDWIGKDPGSIPLLTLDTIRSARNNKDTFSSLLYTLKFPEQLLPLKSMVEQLRSDILANGGGPLFKNMGGPEEETNKSSDSNKSQSTIGNLLSLITKASIQETVQNIALGVVAMMGLMPKSDKAISNLIPGGELVSKFGLRNDPKTGQQAFHSGIDIKAKLGQVIPAYDDGTIVAKGHTADYGNFVVTKYKNYDHYFRYAHLQEPTQLNINQAIQQGATLGLVGNTGRSTGPHVHLELIRDVNIQQLKSGQKLNQNQFVDPEKYINEQYLKKKMSQTTPTTGTGGPFYGRSLFDGGENWPQYTRHKLNYTDYLISKYHLPLSLYDPEYPSDGYEPTNKEYKMGFGENGYDINLFDKFKYLLTLKYPEQFIYDPYITVRGPQPEIEYYGDFISSLEKEKPEYYQRAIKNVETAKTIYTTWLQSVTKPEPTKVQAINQVEEKTETSQGSPFSFIKKLSNAVGEKVGSVAGNVSTTVGNAIQTQSNTANNATTKSASPIVSNTNNIMDSVKRMIKNHEGLRLERYICPTGHPTIGYGHTGIHVQKGRITQAEADQIFEEDFIKYSALAKQIPEFSSLDPARQGALIDLVYNLGYKGFMNFQKTRQALATQNWSEAASELLNSRYARQVGRRAQTIANIFKTGQLGNMPSTISPTGATSIIASEADSVQGVPTQPINIASTGSNIIANLLRGSGRISSKFGMRTHPVDKTQKLHKGIDVAAGAGTPIISPWPGKVIINKNNPKGYGWYTVIDHGNFATLYGHMSQQSPLAVGSQVNTGDVIGMVGSTGASTGPHLHFEVRPGSGNYFNRSPVDPLTFTGASLPSSAMDAVDTAAQEMTQQTHITPPQIKPGSEAFKRLNINNLNKAPQQISKQITPQAIKAIQKPVLPAMKTPTVVSDPINDRFNQLVQQYGLNDPDKQAKLDQKYNTLVTSKGIGGLDSFIPSINFGGIGGNLLGRVAGLTSQIPMMKTLSSLEDQDYLANILQGSITGEANNNSNVTNNTAQPNIIVINQNSSSSNVSNRAQSMTQEQHAGSAKSTDNIFGTW